MSISAFVAWFLLLTNCIIFIEAGPASFQERCDERRNVTTQTQDGATTTVMYEDSCSAEQFLKCSSAICGCQDPANQIFGWKEIQGTEPRRSKRSPKKGSKGSGKGSAVKAVAIGAAAGIGAYQLNKAVDHISQPSDSTSHGSRKEKAKKVTVKSCYSRVGTKCAIDPDRTKTVVHTQETVVNGTTKIETKEFTVNYRKEMSDCVQDAECKVKAVRTLTEDANIGECVCRDGYLHDQQKGTCAKVQRSTGTESVKTGIHICLLTLISILVN